MLACYFKQRNVSALACLPLLPCFEGSVLSTYLIMYVRTQFPLFFYIY